MEGEREERRGEKKGVVRESRERNSLKVERYVVCSA